MSEIDDVIEKVRNKLKCDALILTDEGKPSHCICRQPRITGINIMPDEIMKCLEDPQAQKQCLDFQKRGYNLEAAARSYDDIRRHMNNRREPQETKHKARNIQFQKHDVTPEGWKT